APAVERAADGVADDAAAFAEVGAEVRAVGVEGVRGAGGVAVEDEVVVEVAERACLARGELVGAGDDEPAVGQTREGKEGGHGAIISPGGRGARGLMREVDGGTAVVRMAAVMRVAAVGPAAEVDDATVDGAAVDGAAVDGTAVDAAATVAAA